MHPTVEQLLAVLPPPAGTDPPTDWARAVDVLGTALPQDYRDFVDRYGGGELDGELTVVHADDVRPATGARDGFTGYRRFAVEEIRGTFLEVEAHEGPYPYRFYPDPDGLLVWGRTLNGDVLFWLTGDPDPDRWPVVVWFRGRNPDHPWQHFDRSMAQLVLDLVLDPSEVSLELLGEHEQHSWERVPT